MYKDKFAKRLRSIREGYKLSNDDLSNLSGLKSRTSINDFESLRTFPSAKILNNIADLFAVSTDWLLGRSNIVYQQDIISAAEENFINQKKLPSFEYISKSQEYKDPSLREKSFSLPLRANILFIFFWINRIPIAFNSERQRKLYESQKGYYCNFLEKILISKEIREPIFFCKTANKIIVDQLNSEEALQLLNKHCFELDKFKINRLLFSNRLRELRISHGLSTSQLASILGFKSKGSIGNFESGKAIPLADSLYSIANFFKVSLDYLTGRSDIPYLLNTADSLTEETIQNNYRGFL